MSNPEILEKEVRPAQEQPGAEATDFSYTYSAKQNREIEQIRKKYLPPEENRLEQLHRLDKRAERPGTIAAIAIGSTGTLLLGIGMVLTMVYTRYFAAGIAIGLTGIAGICVSYPVYQSITKRERRKIAPEILRLSDELMKGSR